MILIPHCCAAPHRGHVVSDGRGPQTDSGAAGRRGKSVDQCAHFMILINNHILIICLNTETVI